MKKIIESFTCQPIDIFIILKVTGLNLEKKKIQNTENGKFSIAKHTEKKRVEK